MVQEKERTEEAKHLRRREAMGSVAQEDMTLKRKVHSSL